MPLFREKYNWGPASGRDFPDQIAVVRFICFSHGISSVEIKIIFSLNLKQESLGSIHRIRLVRAELWEIVRELTAIFFRKNPLEKHDGMEIWELLITGTIHIEI